MSDCLERMILPALLSGRCSKIRLHTSPIRVACLYQTINKKCGQDRIPRRSQVRSQVLKEHNPLYMVQITLGGFGRRNRIEFVQNRRQISFSLSVEVYSRARPEKNRVLACSGMLTYSP